MYIFLLFIYESCMKITKAGRKAEDEGGRRGEFSLRGIMLIQLILYLLI